MKKTLVVILLISIFIIPSNTFAQTAYLKDIKYTKSGNQDIISLYSTNYTGFKVSYLTNPDRVIVDMPNNIVAMKGSGTIGTIKVSSALIESIRYSQFTKSAARVVFDVKGKPQYKVEQKNGCLTLIFDKLNVSRGDLDRTITAENRITYTSSVNVDKIIIPGNNHEGYKVLSFTKPDRLVIDIPNCIVPKDQKYIPGNMNLVINTHYMQLDSKTARIIVETTGKPPYRIVNEQNQLVLYLESETYKNILYTKNVDSARLTLKGVRLTEVVQAKSSEGAVDGTAAEAAGTTPLYTESLDQSGKRYTILFPSSLANLDIGKLIINDEVIDSIEISKDAEKQTTAITFNARFSRIYQVTTNRETNVTEILIIKPYSKNDSLVVLDAGHGGSDPGASYAGIKEKDLNLKIAIRVDAILKANGIKTYMTRNDDTFIPLRDRVDIANDLNAVLFLSIHNNAFNSSESGTETLCYPSEKSKQFAGIIQKTLVNALGTKNRGVIERPNLVVLNATKMPAALAEIVYITNDGDRQKLMKNEFIESAALALANSIISALDIMEINK